METLPSAGHRRSLDVANPEDMEPEDMKARRHAALREFGVRNPKYHKFITDQLKLELKGAMREQEQSIRKQLSFNKGQAKRNAQRVAGREGKKNWWTTRSSLELLDAVTRFEKSESRVIGKEKWKIIATDLLQQPNSPPNMNLKEITESAKYCRIRYCNMLARRHARGTSYALTDELKEKLEGFSDSPLTKICPLTLSTPWKKT